MIQYDPICIKQFDIFIHKFIFKQINTDQIFKINYIVSNILKNSKNSQININ